MIHSQSAAEPPVPNASYPTMHQLRGTSATDALIESIEVGLPGVRRSQLNGWARRCQWESQNEESTGKSQIRGLQSLDTLLHSCRKPRKSSNEAKSGEPSETSEEPPVLHRKLESNLEHSRSVITRKTRSETYLQFPCHGVARSSLDTGSS